MNFFVSLLSLGEIVADWPVSVLTSMPKVQNLTIEANILRLLCQRIKMQAIWQSYRLSNFWSEAYLMCHEIDKKSPFPLKFNILMQSTFHEQFVSEEEFISQNPCAIK